MKIKAINSNLQLTSVKGEHHYTGSVQEMLVDIGWKMVTNSYLEQKENKINENIL